MLCGEWSCCSGLWLMDLPEEQGQWEATTAEPVSLSQVAARLHSAGLREEEADLNCEFGALSQDCCSCKGKGVGRAAYDCLFVTHEVENGTRGRQPETGFLEFKQGIIENLTPMEET